MSEKTPTSYLTRLGARALRVSLVLFALTIHAGISFAADVMEASLHPGTLASIYSADYVLEHHVLQDGDRAWLEIPDYGRVELLLPQDVGGNTGVERFYPHQPAHVADALASVEHPASIEGLRVYILPYPRVGLTSSSAVDSKIFLSPGIHPIAEEVTHMVTTHELGHVFHNNFAPDSNDEIWSQYRTLRSIEDSSVYCVDAQHRNRPHEIFAEDFRFLFGGLLANYSLSIENSDLLRPDLVVGLETFMLGLGRDLSMDKAPSILAASNYPNPFNPTTRIGLSAERAQLGEALSVQVFDAQGRHIKTLHEGTLDRIEMNFEWNGTNETGHPVPSGVYFSRIRVGHQQLSHKMLLIS